MCVCVYWLSLLLLGSLSWCNEQVTSGSRDNAILQWDPRLPAFPTRRLLGHVQEVCGLKWSPDNRHLASGGNDNKVRITIVIVIVIIVIVIVVIVIVVIVIV